MSPTCAGVPLGSPRPALEVPPRRLKFSSHITTLASNLVKRPQQSNLPERGRSARHGMPGTLRARTRASPSHVALSDRRPPSVQVTWLHRMDPANQLTALDVAAIIGRRAVTFSALVRIVDAQRAVVEQAVREAMRCGWVITSTMRPPAVAGYESSDSWRAYQREPFLTLTSAGLNALAGATPVL
jgi:hypothetical protein